jgi:RimJ/RimL family protein N-acetyltransferase
MNIEGKRIIIRAIEVEDLPTLHTWANDPKLASLLVDIHFPSSLWEQQRWFERIKTQENTVRLAVQQKTGPLIGYTGFWDIDWRNQHAEHAVVIGDPENRKKGYGTEVILTCARYAFEEMGLYRLEASILETNEDSFQTYQKCGFKIEGKLRGRILRGGKRVNVIKLALLAREYLSQAKNRDAEST